MIEYTWSFGGHTYHTDGGYILTMESPAAQLELHAAGTLRWGTAQGSSYEQPPETERPDPLAPPEGYDHDAPRGRDRQPDQPLPDRCSVEFSGKPCQVPMAVILWWGDINEHVFPMGYCGRHAVQVVATQHGAWCTTCSEPLHLIRIEPGGAAEHYGMVQGALDGLGCRDHPLWNGRPS